MRTRAIAMCASLPLLASCMALVATIGTPEEEIVDRNSTASSLEARLGKPTTVSSIDPPQSVWSLRSDVRGVVLLVDATVTILPNGAREMRYPPAWVASRADYPFHGVLKRKHDVGEALGFSLMTLGVGELLTPVYGTGKTDRPYVLTVWLDATGQVLAYRWSEAKPGASATE